MATPAMNAPSAKPRISRFHQPLMTARFQPRTATQDETTFQLVQDIMETPTTNRWSLPDKSNCDDTLTYVRADGCAQEKSRPVNTDVCAKPNRFFSRFTPPKLETKTPSSTPTERKSRFEPVPVLPSQESYLENWT